MCRGICGGSDQFHCRRRDADHLSGVGLGARQNPVGDCQRNEHSRAVQGSAAGAWAYRRELGTAYAWLRLLLVPCIVGGIAGAVALVYFPERIFALLVPG